MKIEWSDAYSIHNDHLDEQHRKLFVIAKRAEDLIRKQADANEIKEILFALFDYMKFHFADEEAYMEQIGYPELRQHQEIHRSIVERMTVLIQNIRYDFKQKLAIIVRDWLVEHIMQEDMKIEHWHQSVKNQPPLVYDKQKTIEYFYRCNCRERFRVLETVHQRIQQGQKYHCKKCNAPISFLRVEES